MFTVIVAVYNAERTLARCLDSLLCQTLADIEVLCVDDASIDASLQCLMAYALKDNRVRVFSLCENRGAAHARNVALRHAKGAYTTFLDSDDWMSADCLQRTAEAFAAHPSVDCVLFKLVNVDENGRQTDYPMQPARYDGYDAFVKSLSWDIHGCYAVKTALHLLVPYDESCRAYSDDNTTRLHYLRSHEVDCCDGVYYYYQNAASVTHSVSIRHFDYLEATVSMRRQLVQMGQPASVLRLYERIRWWVVVDMYGFWYLHRQELGPRQSAYALAMIRRTWRGIDTASIPFRFKAKLGYIPFHGLWRCFFCEEWLYFSLKRLLRKI